ncbi:alpha/beta-hydrolase [Lactarius hengduanensis]|nr:alpha/beta-hydrolase [Lactarius hengduanensis]
MASEQPFKIAVPDDALALLKRKLDDTRLPDEVDAAEWAYGAPLADIKRLVSKWKDGYDWRTHERELNALPMFTRTIAVDGFGELDCALRASAECHQGCHPAAVRARLYVVSRFYPAGPLMSDAGPGSFLEVTKILPLLTSVSADHPIFPRCGTESSWLFNKLMISLGYSEYVTQGGDWGHVLTLAAASKYGPEHVKASHTNMPIPTKPQTLGFSLADSPVGLLAWIYEKLVAWSDAYPWTDDEVLTWISIYWFSRAGPAASVRIYYEYAHLDNPKRARFPETSVPVGFSFFPKEVMQLPRVCVPNHTSFVYSVFVLRRTGASSLLRAQAKVVFESEHEVGGHFAAYEQPEALVSDLRTMFGKSGPAAGVVPGCTGY